MQLFISPLLFLSKLIKLVVAITAVFIKLFCLGDKKKPASHTTKQHKELRQSGKLNYERLCLVGGGGICVAVTVLCYGTMGPLA